MIMGRLLFLLLLAVSMLDAMTIRLYLKDGGYHTVSEYKVVEDRVRYFSTERGDWEEIPLDLVDLKKTEAEQKTMVETAKEEATAEKEESKAEAEFHKEIASIPADAGAYWITPQGMKPLKLAEQKIVNNKRREVLKVLSPIPMVAGKSTVEIDGDKSAFVITDERPEFYFRLWREERLAIYKMKPGKGNTRIVENIAIMPVTREFIEEPVEIETFRRQVGEQLFRIWPTKPLEPGEYAVVEYSPPVEQGLTLQVYDFSIRSKSK
jgi:hypothetical protein